MIFELVKDFAAVLEAMPQEHPRRRILKLLEEAIRRDVHFIDRHPTTLFQCLWNTCWWYDCPEAAERYDAPDEGWSKEGPPWDQNGEQLHNILESWEAFKEHTTPGFFWVRSLRPPVVVLGASQQMKFKVQELAPFRSRGAFFSENGEFVLIPYADSLRIFESATGKEIVDDRLHDSSHHDKTYSKDKRRYVIAASDDAIEIVQAGSGAKILTVTNPFEMFDIPVVFSPDGRWIGAGGGDADMGVFVSVWNSWTGDQGPSFGGEVGVADIAFSPDGSLVACAGYDNAIRIWDMITENRVACLRGSESCAFSVNFSPDGRSLVTLSKDGTVCVYALSFNAPAPLLRGHVDLIGDIAFSPDGTYIVSQSFEGGLFVWDTVSGQERACLCPCHLTRIEGVTRGVVVSDDSQMIGAAQDGRLKIWNAATFDEIACVDISGSSRCSPELQSLVERVCERIWNPLAPRISFPPHCGPWRTGSRKQETVIESVRDQAEAAWFPGTFDETWFPGIVANPVRQVWATAHGHVLHLFALEGGN